MIAAARGAGSIVHRCALMNNIIDRAHTKERYPNGYACHFVRPKWVLPRRKTAAYLVRGAKL